MFRTTEYLVPNILRRQQHRSKPYATIIGTEGVQRHIKYSDIENASNRASWFLAEKVADDKVLYMGSNDIRYLIWIIAAIKTGKCVLLPSPSNQIPENQRFFERVGAKTLLYAPEAADTLAPLLGAMKETMDHIASPTFEALFHNDIVPIYPFEKTFDDVKDTIFMGLHTSGTSGHPKPIHWNHPALSIAPSFLDTSIFGGIGSTLWSLYCNNTLVFPAGHCTSAALAPSMLEAMLSYPAGMDALATLKSIAYGGRPLNPHRGEILAKRLPCLINILASTEGGLGHFQLSKDSSCSGFFKFIELGQRMEEVSAGIYELVYPQTELINRTHAFFHTNPDLEVEFRTSDLLSPVKGKDGYWEYKGRKDNWIAMSNGLKMDPTEMESTISARPDVSGALVAGSHCFRLCLLIELKTKSAAPELDTTWPTIEAANKKVTKFGRVPKELVIFAPAGKPFSRASKGTIQWLLTSGIALPSSTEAQELMPFLTEICSETLFEDTDNSNISVDDNLLVLGLDSLFAFVLIARLKAALKAYGVEPEKVQRVDSRLIYSATTIRQLAVNLSGMLSEIETSNRPVEHRINDLMVELLEKYNAEILKLPGATCILTGSSGSLGSYVLSSLLSRGDVKKVFCLNRKTDAQAQPASFKIRGLPELSVDDGRVVFLQVKPTEPKLGLSDDIYDSLVQETTSIIHNAYPVNFLLSLESMEPQFEFLLNLLRLAAKGPKNPGVLFVSSIAAASSTAFNGSQIKIPEKVLDLEQAKNLLPQGYTRSKPATVLRVGQVCGPLSGGGTWNASEWIPSLVQSSKFLGAVPESLGGQEVNWVPVDKLGDVTAQIVCAAAPKNGDLAALTVYNVVNPSTTSWAELLPGLKSAGSLEVVSAAEWVDRLEKSDKGHHVIHVNPAEKLVDFYKEALLDNSPVAKFELSNLLGASEIAASLQPITADNMAKWLRGWGL
ncbi:hypothetical protein F4809DRAFT_651608 [Biscogniauxia mediterranea]|nr:hypothetical protein F4809DRAFT_651608 [Biscogniauxia mediterranea]